METIKRATSGWSEIPLGDDRAVVMFESDGCWHFESPFACDGGFDSFDEAAKALSETLAANGIVVEVEPCSGSCGWQLKCASCVARKNAARVTA